MYAGPRCSTWAAVPQRRSLSAAAAADSGSWSGEAEPSSPAASSAASKAPPAGFASLEKLIATQYGGGPGGDWREVEGCFVLYPPAPEGAAEGAAAEPRCLVQFLGGSFVGAAPQLAYRPLLEALAARGALVCACLLCWLGGLWAGVCQLAMQTCPAPPGRTGDPHPPPNTPNAGGGGAICHGLRPLAAGG